jgi:hypothetical protein
VGLAVPLPVGNFNVPILNPKPGRTNQLLTPLPWVDEVPAFLSEPLESANAQCAMSKVLDGLFLGETAPSTAAFASHVLFIVVVLGASIFPKSTTTCSRNQKCQRLSLAPQQRRAGTIVITGITKQLPAQTILPLGARGTPDTMIKKCK